MGEQADAEGNTPEFRWIKVRSIEEMQAFMSPNLMQSAKLLSHAVMRLVFMAARNATWI